MGVLTHWASLRHQLIQAQNANAVAELQRHKEAKYEREVSPWAARPSAFQDDAEEGVPSPDSQQDMDMEGTSPEGATGYYATGQDSAFQFEPPRAPAHYGASRNSPGPADQYSGFHSGWGTSAGGLSLSFCFMIQPIGVVLMSDSHYRLRCCTLTVTHQRRSTSTFCMPTSVSVQAGIQAHTSALV